MLSRLLWLLGMWVLLSVVAALFLGHLIQVGGYSEPLPPVGKKDGPAA